MIRKLLLILFFLCTACSNSKSQAPSTPTQITETKLPSTRFVPSPTATVNSSPSNSIPQSLPTPATYGPDEFPKSYNPLTGQQVTDPALLNIPALLISISHFPPAARPQAGLSFSPFVFEYFITEGATRYLSVFYGEEPAPEIPWHGDCKISSEPIPNTNFVLGNRVWRDQNQNGIQEIGEDGIGGVCVSLLNENGTSLQQTTTDSNGYYGFNVEAGNYIIKVEKPAWLEFAQKNVGAEDSDSDVDQVTGQTDTLNVTSSLLFWDAGLVASPNVSPTPD